MVIPKEYSYNSAAKYLTGAVFNYTAAERASIRQFLLNPTIYVNQTACFTKKYLDVAAKYVLPKIYHDADVQRWYTNPMVFWQNQLNFAIWCATTGCGVSVRDHLLLQSSPMLTSLYRFHVYFQTLKILNHMRCPLPSDPTWNAFNNAINMTTYELICNEFGVDKGTDWRQKHDANSGLGKVYNYWTLNGYHVVDDGTYYTHAIRYRSRQSFTEETTNEVLHIDYIQQGSDVDDGFVYCMLDKSVGFTRVGVVRLNDSIRAYVWAILGAQGAMRTSIIGVGTAFDAQENFIANIQARIDHEVDPPTSVSTYQDVLHYARSKLDFVLGGGLYMIPSDMNLKIIQIENYNNKIVVADEVSMSLGTNQELNPVRLTRAVVVPQPTLEPSVVPRPLVIPTVVVTPVVPTLSTTGGAGDASPIQHAVKTSHEARKTALVVGAVGLSLVAMTFR